MIYKELHEMFPEEVRVTNKELKSIIQSLYDKYKITATATATDIKKFGFNAKPCKVYKDGERLNGLILTQNG